jgi:hypothetical protein
MLTTLTKCGRGSRQVDSCTPIGIRNQWRILKALLRFEWINDHYHPQKGLVMIMALKKCVLLQLRWNIFLRRCLLTELPILDWKLRNSVSFRQQSGTEIVSMQWLKLALSERPKRVCVSLPSPEDGNRSSFRNVVFSMYLEFRTMDKVQNPLTLIVTHHLQNALHSTSIKRKQYNIWANFFILLVKDDCR